ncbi:hypothetical protein GCM10009715_27570 [Paeniglutamicibacter psychrophenolicus]|uniref:HipA-like protein n=1 Tax=Paeniglutamicibacter psychrophenolicus TaxID=257454 RepID=A0ABS4WGK4_9MICC|nr:HipA N-terminal domain-containing protein [Paeniglutamicibacter psychrophenolicus]MBP2374709.1 HipA-like protein [Paeniglutamicibacter psychrophenolicus]
MAESLPVHLFGAAIGRIERAGSTSVVFCADHEGLDVYGVGSTILSASLPFSAAPSPAGASTNFFGGLLPEGRGRTNLAKQAGVDSTDVFGMLGYAGWDLPGDVNVGMDPGPTAEHIPASVGDVERLLTRTSDYAMGTVGGGGSLPGVQPKATLALFDGQWHITKGGAVSTHIVRPVAAGEEWGAHWEAGQLLAVSLALVDTCRLCRGARGSPDAGRPGIRACRSAPCARPLYRRAVARAVVAVAGRRNLPAGDP